MAVLVASAVLVVPGIKRKSGYPGAILMTQSAAIGALIMLATTEYYSSMNMAKPMISKLMMYYPGKNKQEIVSAINASFWAGTWFISAQ